MNYVDLRMGYQLPMVGVLQHLLNRTGASLIPDGKFGPRTFLAVRSFQAPRGLLVDGLVGEQTWAQLTHGVSLPIIDSVNIWDPVSPIGSLRSGMEQSVGKLSGARNVFLLRFHGYRPTAGATVASGSYEHSPKQSQPADIASDAVMLQILGSLHPIFGSYGCVEFIDCPSMRGVAGKRMMSQLAGLLGVPIVRAASFSEPVGTVVPGGGSLAGWCASRPTLVGMKVA